MAKFKNILKRITTLLFADLKACRVALVILLLYIVLAQSIFHTVCPFAICFGFPCPACGLTRAAGHLMRGDLLAAWQTNATIFLWVPLIIAWFVCRYLVGCKLSRLLPFVIITALLTILYYMYRLFAGTTVTVPCSGLVPESFIKIVSQVFENSIMGF